MVKITRAVCVVVKYQQAREKRMVGQNQKIVKPVQRAVHLAAQQVPLQHDDDRISGGKNHIRNDILYVGGGGGATDEEKYKNDDAEHEQCFGSVLFFARKYFPDGTFHIAGAERSEGCQNSADFFAHGSDS